MNHVITAVAFVAASAIALSTHANPKLLGSWRVTKIAKKGQLKPVSKNEKSKLCLTKDGKFTLRMSATSKGNPTLKTVNVTYELKAGKLVTRIKARRKAQGGKYVVLVKEVTHVFKLKSGLLTFYSKKKPRMIMKKIAAVCSTVRMPTVRPKDYPMLVVQRPRAKTGYTPPNHEQQLLRWILDQKGNN